MLPLVSLKRIFRSKNKKIIDRWFKINGDKTLRLNYDLNKNSLVFDLGGYEGQWTSDIFAKYCCKIYVFEPVKKFSENIKKRFSGNEKIKIYNFGLAGENKKTTISLRDDESSIFKKGKNREEISLIKASIHITD